MFKLTLGIVLFMSVAFAQDKAELSPEKEKFCSERLDSPVAIQDLLLSERNQLAFYNQGGLFGGGVCWWHSRITRNAAYLAFFRPELPKPSDEDAAKLVKALRKGKYVEIPGYRDLSEFSRYNSSIFQERLNEWQRTDGFVRQAWTTGLTGSNKMSSDDFGSKLDELYERVQRGEVVYQMLQLPGVVAHAWLVLKMDKTDDGYKLTILDSNSGVDNYYYRKGMENFKYSYFGKFMPYTYKTNEEAKLRKKLMKQCNRKAEVEEKPSEEVEANVEVEPKDEEL